MSLEIAAPQPKTDDDVDGCCFFSGDCCNLLNKVFMGLSGVLLFCACILVWYGGIGAYGLDFWQNAHDSAALRGTLNGFVSCSSTYTAVFNNESAPTLPYTANPNSNAMSTTLSSRWVFMSLNPTIQAAQMAKCGASQAPMVFLTAWTGLFLVVLGIAGVYAAFSGSRVAAFSSGITIAFTLAMVLVNITFAIIYFGPVGPFIPCTGMSTLELGMADELGVCYDLGQNPNYLFSVLDVFAPNGVASYPIKTLSAWATRVACFYAGAGLALVSIVMLKWTTTSVYRRGSRDGQGTNKI